MTVILNIGMNHETAPVSLRESLATEAGNDTIASTFIAECKSVREAMFFSTCNRVEAVVAGEDSAQMERAVLSVMARLGKISADHLASCIYTLTGREAIKHLFMVASSLDSMIVGEPQILGQIKQAYAGAVSRKTSGVILNRLMHRAFHTAKRVRTETGICESAVSVSYAAVEMAKKIFHKLEGINVLLIGAGEMAELAARHLLGQGAGALVVANRTFDRAQEIACLFKASAAGLDDIESLLLETDIVISSTASPGYVLNHSQIKNALKRRRSRALFLIDIAVPRDVDPEVNRLDNVYVYDIDDLKGVVQFNVDQRRQESLKAERIVLEEVAKFEKWIRTLHVVPTIAALREKAAGIVMTEMKRSAPSMRDLNQEQLDAVKVLADSIAGKIVNDPILFLKSKSDSGMRDGYLDVTRRLFHLDEDINHGGRMNHGINEKPGHPNESPEESPWISKTGGSPWE